VQIYLSRFLRLSLAFERLARIVELGQRAEEKLGTVHQP
jgi:hypothetical protein